MIFPIGDDQVVGGVKPYVSYSLIAINVIVFLAQFTMYTINGEGWLGQFFMANGAIPSEIVNGEDLFTLFTSIFLHGGWMHLIGNMVFLWVFADNIEATIGNINFFLFYMLGGLAASLTHIYLDADSGIPGIGASGAIAACLGAYLVLYPRSQVKMFVIFMVRSFKIPALLFLLFWIGQQLFVGIGSLGAQGEASGGVAWWAHIGGFVFGVIVGLVIRQFMEPKTLTVSAATNQTRRRRV